MPIKSPALPKLLSTFLPNNFELCTNQTSGLRNVLSTCECLGQALCTWFCILSFADWLTVAQHSTHTRHAHDYTTDLTRCGRRSRASAPTSRCRSPPSPRARSTTRPWARWAGRRSSAPRGRPARCASPSRTAASAPATYSAPAPPGDKYTSVHIHTKSTSEPHATSFC